MTPKDPWGGKRRGAGRKPIINNDITIVKRIPQSIIPLVEELIQQNRNNITIPNLPADALFPYNQANVKTPFVLDKIPAGFPSPAEGYIENYIDLNDYLIKNKPATFIVRAGGDSMHDAGIDKEDLLIIDRSLKPHHLDIVMANLNSEFTIKRLHIVHGTLELHPENEAAQYPILTPHESETWSIVGVVTSVIKVFKP